MSDPREREQLDHIEQRMRLTDPNLVRSFETSWAPRARRRLPVVAWTCVYTLALTLLILGAAGFSFPLFAVGSIMLRLAGCLHLITWMYQR